MSNEKQETIADIVAALRAVAYIQTAESPIDVLSFADRIEVAHKREVADEKRISDAVIQSLRDKKLEMDGEIAEKEAKMREAFDNIAEYAKAAACHTEDAHLLGYLNQIERWAEAALSTPPRN